MRGIKYHMHINNQVVTFFFFFANLITFNQVIIINEINSRQLDLTNRENDITFLNYIQSRHFHYILFALSSNRGVNKKSHLRNEYSTSVFPFL